LKIVSDFTKAIRIVCEGQSLDEDFEIRNEVSIREYKEMISKKTAALLEMSCSIGAQIVTDDKALIRKLENYGRSLGMAFQLQDDLLDLMANETKFGKVPGGDLIEGKKTFLLLNALEIAKGKDLKEIKRLIKNRGITPEEVGKFREMFIRLGVVENTKKQIKLYTDKAIKNLNGMPNEEAANLLTWLAFELTARES
jgi:geranylgeranyl diphosphate synthase type II